MTYSTLIGEMFSPSHIIDILLYIADNPGCKKTDIYNEVTRNASTSGRIDVLVKVGLVDRRQYGAMVILDLTDKGKVMADHFKAPTGPSPVSWMGQKKSESATLSKKLCFRWSTIHSVSDRRHLVEALRIPSFFFTSSTSEDTDGQMDVPQQVVHNTIPIA